MPMTIPPTVERLDLSNVSLTKGDVVVVDNAGFVVIATVALTVKRKAFVTIEAVDNSGGVAGDKDIEVVGAKQRVTVQTTSTLSPGDGVKVSAIDGKVQLFDVVLDDDNIRIGHYIGIEPGVYVKDTGSPFAEGYTVDKAEADAAVNDIVIVELE